MTAGAIANAKLAVKWNVLPWPALLSSQRRPPINCTSYDENRQAKSGAAIGTCHRAIDLCEGLEDALLTIERDANARVLDREVQYDVMAVSRADSSAVHVQTERKDAVVYIDHYVRRERMRQSHNLSYWKG